MKKAAKLFLAVTGVAAVAGVASVVHSKLIKPRKKFGMSMEDDWLADWDDDNDYHEEDDFDFFDDASDSNKSVDDSEGFADTLSGVGSDTKHRRSNKRFFEKSGEGVDVSQSSLLNRWGVDVECYDSMSKDDVDTSDDFEDWDIDENTDKNKEVGVDDYYADETDEDVAERQRQKQEKTRKEIRKLLDEQKEMEDVLNNLFASMKVSGVENQDKSALRKAINDIFVTITSLFNVSLASFGACEDMTACSDMLKEISPAFYKLLDTCVKSFNERCKEVSGVSTICTVVTEYIDKVKDLFGALTQNVVSSGKDALVFDYMSRISDLTADCRKACVYDETGESVF